jgi:hypothetical protein
MYEERTRRAVEETIKWLQASKPGKPGGDLADPPKPKDEKK